MKHIDRIRQQLSEARRAYLDSFRTGNITGAQQICMKVHDLEARLAEAEEYELKRLSDQLPSELMRKEKIPENIAAIHLIMDCLVEVTMDFRLKLKKHDLIESQLYAKVKQLEKYADSILAEICNLKQDGLTRFITDNDELIDDMCKLVYDYIDRKLDVKA